jgi:L-histidine Nalpha-methyltransferase
MNAPLFVNLQTPQFVQLHRDDSEAIRTELSAGLLATAAHTSPKYLYNALGSQLFAAITELPEYYPTRTEAQIFKQFGAHIAQAVGTGSTLVDLGAGNCQKAASLFSALLPAQYVPVDISVEFLRSSVENLQQQFPSLPMLGVGMDFSQTINLPTQVRNEQRVFFYPGSSIGNFTPEQALSFLELLAQQGRARAVLFGVDLAKPKTILEPAYDDALGVTAAFNKNLLLHINHLLGANFDVKQWQHVAFFNEAASRIEMHLQATQDCQVRWGQHMRQFAAGERVHTENSYKYTLQSFSALLQSAGYAQLQHWCDAQQHFAVFYAQYPR